MLWQQLVSWPAMTSQAIPMTPLISERAPDEALTRRSPLPVAALAVAYAAAYLLWLRFGGASPRVRDLASESVFLPLNAALALVF